MGRVWSEDSAGCARTARDIDPLDSFGTDSFMSLQCIKTAARWEIRAGQEKDDGACVELRTVKPGYSRWGDTRKKPIGTTAGCSVVEARGVLPTIRTSAVPELPS